MKIRQATYPSHRRRNPLVLPAIVVVALIVALFVWAWIEGGAQPVAPVEKPVPAERLGR